MDNRQTFRQYIGARYVPKFYENEDGTFTWESGVQYEPLTIVKYSTNTYVSKKLVPSTVGSPNLNTEYWALTGDYNGAVVALQQTVNSLQTDVNTLEGDVNTLEEAVTGLDERVDGTETAIGNNASAITATNQRIIHKNLVILGDSYGMRNTVTWTTILANVFPVAFNQSVSSRGFLISGNSYETGLDSAIAELTADQRAAVTDIVVGGGWNDARALTNGATMTQLDSAITSFRTKALENFPNATVDIVFMAWQRFNNTQPETNHGDLRRVMTAYNTARGERWRCITGAQCVLYDGGNYDTSGFHPNNDGGTALGVYIAQELMGGRGEYIQARGILNADVTYASNITSHSAADFICSYNNQNVVFNCPSAITIQGEVTTSLSDLITFPFDKMLVATNPLMPEGWFDGTIGGTPYKGIKPYLYFDERYCKLRVIWPASGAINGMFRFRWIGIGSFTT